MNIGLRCETHGEEREGEPGNERFEEQHLERERERHITGDRSGARIHLANHEREKVRLAEHKG